MMATWELNKCVIRPPSQGPVLTKNLFFCSSFFFLIYLHLIGRKVNLTCASIFKANSKVPNSTITLSGLLCLDFNFQIGSLSTWTWHVPRNRSGPRKIVRVSSAASEARSRHCER